MRGYRGSTRDHFSVRNGGPRRANASVDNGDHFSGRSGVHSVVRPSGRWRMTAAGDVKRGSCTRARTLVTVTAK